MSRQDLGVPEEPRVRLRLLLALLRLVAGRRGYASVKWHGAGFTYELRASRIAGSPTDVELDVDPTALELEAARARLREALQAQP